MQHQYGARARYLQERLARAVVGVIDPGARAAVDATERERLA